MKQCSFFPEIDKPHYNGCYKPVLTVTENGKGVLDVDTVKGCTLGMQAYPIGGCYGECYAYKNAVTYGFKFRTSVSRKILDREHRDTINRGMNRSDATWYRIGTAGDPCHDWENTLAVCRALRYEWTRKIPVIITKHWVPLSDNQILELKNLRAAINTSVSGMDTDCEITHRTDQMDRIKRAGASSVCRVVTCDYGNSEWARERKEKQDYLLSLEPVIDNPLRARKSNPHVLNGDIILIRRRESIGGGKYVSLHSPTVYLGTCRQCPDQCGVDLKIVSAANERIKYMATAQKPLFVHKTEFEYVQAVIGSGYEKDVAKLALEDGIAHRAARKNMQIHSAVILKIDGEFAGFMTFQNNDEAKEFCLLQSVIKPKHYSDDLYREMVLAVIERNVNGYPAIMTTNPKSKFETPALYESIGFKTYLAMSGFCYMVHGELSDVRMKLLAHITMTNVWNTVKGDWLKLKKAWKARIEDAGIRYSIVNPTYATRDGCWQGTAGFANVVTGHSHNGNASVLDPVACEIILRFFMPKNGRRIYNPFGGGVQFGFVAGACRYEYLASEIRQNQCDANNKLCSEFAGVEWIKSDSATYKPDGKFDLVFTCPPYYKVEKYIDYDGKPPAGEINSFSTYEDFRSALFSGYKIAIDHLNDNCFFVVMTGDSRDKNGAYYCSEAETELFFKEIGLSVYNKIVYLECEFTRLAQAKKTLNYRKFPKREQKIIVAYKGDISAIKELYAPLGRL
ncbi:MAG: hypothetical protein ABIH23_05860 [bacterium]